MAASGICVRVCLSVSLLFVSRMPYGDILCGYLCVDTSVFGLHAVDVQL